MILGVVPCKVSSKRVPRKNFIEIGGETLLARAILYLQTSKLIDKIEAYTDDLDDPDIKRHAARFPDVEFRRQYPDQYPEHTDLYPWIASTQHPNDDIEMLVCAAPDNPIRPTGIDDFIEEVRLDNLYEYVTVDVGRTKVGALHIISRVALKTNHISGSTRSVMVDAIDINNQDDLKKAVKLCSSPANQK
jgi:spore coat polysaccharide biosynthesis protein SpsF (cytidylyltransferase family)